MQPDEHPPRDERTPAPGAAAPSPAGRGRAVIDFRPYPTAPTRTRRSPANFGRHDTRRGNHPPTPSTIWFTPTPTPRATTMDDPSMPAATENADQALIPRQGDVPDIEPSGAAWPLPVLARAVTSFTEPGATVLLQPWTAAATGEHADTVPAVAVETVADLDRRPRLGELSAPVDGANADSTRPLSVNDRVDLLITVMPARGDAADQTDSLARMAARALRLGGVLVVLTHCDRVGGVLVDPTGPMVTAGQNADLLYLQHIVAVHLPPADLRSHPAHLANEPAPMPHWRVHSDVLVFAQPHSSGSSGGAEPATDRPLRP